MKNKLFLISGASGSGKTTLMRSIMDIELVSFTTRSMRAGEVEGRDYIFISRDEFIQLQNNNGLAESTEYGGNYYGLMMNELNYKLSLGDCFFVCDVEGMRQMKELYDNCVSIFIYSEKEDIENRMIARGDDISSIEKRLSTYEAEIENKKHYDYVVVNKQGKFNDTLYQLENIIKVDNET